MDLCNWKTYNFKIYPFDSKWKDVGGIYIFSVRIDYRWQALYIGQASSFKDRLPCHERWEEAYGQGARHIHAMVVAQQFERDRIEKELIQHFQPSMNDRLKLSAWELAMSGVTSDALGLRGMLSPPPVYAQGLARDNSMLGLLLDPPPAPTPQSSGALARLLGIRTPK